MRYRITAGRWDVVDRTVREFEATDDEAAKKVFDALSAREEYAWDTMILYRIEQVERKTPIGSVRVS